MHRSHRVLRFDSASSEYDLAQAGLSGWPTLHIVPPADDAPPGCMPHHPQQQQHEGSMGDSADSSSSTAEGLPAHLLAERWDSAGPEGVGRALLQGGGGGGELLLADIVAGLSCRLHANPVYASGDGPGAAAAGALATTADEQYMLTQVCSS